MSDTVSFGNLAHLRGEVAAVIHQKALSFSLPKHALPVLYAYISEGSLLGDRFLARLEVSFAQLVSVSALLLPLAASRLQ